MVISYRAVYTLLETSYIRCSLEGYINDYIHKDIFKSSLLLAKAIEDYEYLDVMVTKKDTISKEFVMFVRGGELPLTLEVNKSFSMLELSILYTKCSVNIEHFKTLVYDIAYRNGEVPEEQVELFLKATKELSTGTGSDNTEPPK